jgi:hypothetical protein
MDRCFSKMNIFGIFLQVGILWFLITLFTRQTKASVSLQETWIVIAGAMFIGLLTRLFLSGILGPFTLIIDILVLYVLVDKVCGTARKTTMKICGWYLGISFLISISVSLLSRPV